MPGRIRAVLLDFGDTLSDQATERRDEAGTLVGVELIDGARELIGALRERGVPVALVADGEVRDARAALAQHGLGELFDAVVISEARPEDVPTRARGARPGRHRPRAHGDGR